MQQTNSLFNPVVHDLPGLAWCGLCALSCITGYSTATIKNTVKANLIRKHKIAGLYSGEILKSLHDLGFKTVIARCNGTVQNHCNDGNEQTQLIFVQGHVMVRQANMIIDSYARFGQECNKHNYRAYHVVSAYDVFPVVDKEIIKIGNHAFDINEM